MQAKTVTDRDLVPMAVQELCRNAGFSDPTQMVQRDHEFLAESIEKKTGILISLSTIKRLINGEFSRLPQIATLNAIACFLGFENWQQYRAQKLIGADSVETAKIPVIETSEKSNNQLDAGSTRKKYLLAAGIALFAGAMLFSFLRFRSQGLGRIADAKFSARKTTSNEIPNTVVFSYDVDHLNADSFFIQQSWDKNRRVRIYKNNYTLTDIYYEPGYHTAKLIANDSIIKTVDVSIPTDRWFSFAKERAPGSKPKYIEPELGINKGALRFTLDDIARKELDLKKEHEFVHVYFPARYENNSDNFMLKFRIRLTPLSNDYCAYFMAEIFCQKNFMFFTSTPKGCSSEMMLQFSENIQSGKLSDLSSLATDTAIWHDVEVTVHNRTVTIRIDGKESYKSSYTDPSGMITGVGFISNGLVEVDNVDLKGPNGTIYATDFE